jgi:phosphatidylethanolamine-binding protein (PEBP) family uncharacterized protein
MHKSMLAALLVSTALGAHAAGFTLTSPTIKPGSMLTDAQVFKGFGCEGKNVSPALKWSGAPAGTKSYAVTVYDPDAPTGSGWWHWVVYNIPATATSFPKARAPATARARFPPARCRAGPTSAAPASAARARRPATSRTATSSPSTR